MCCVLRQCTRGNHTHESGPSTSHSCCATALRTLPVSAGSLAEVPDGPDNRQEHGTAADDVHQVQDVTLGYRRRELWRERGSATPAT